MLGLQVTEERGPEAVRVAELPLPPEDALVIRVHAAGVGFPDLLMSQGAFQIRQPLPFVLGWEAAREVLRAPVGSASLQATAS